MLIVGFLNSASSAPFAPLVAAFRRGLNENGYVEGQNVAVEYRWAEGQLDRLPALASDLVRRQVAVIVATGAGPSALAAKAATTTIPIVFISGDPLRDGLVVSINRPGGNATGVSLFTNVLAAKRLEILRELLPGVIQIGVLVDSNSPEGDIQSREVQAAARTIGQQILVLNTSSERDFDAAFATGAQQRIGALLVAGSPFFTSQRDPLVGLAARYAIPAIYEWREFPAAGGLISYGTSLPDAYRQVGAYAGRILKGVQPADLPVVQPTRFELVINLKAAKALGLAVPPVLLARADDVIE
jgi:putative ABC transport system substrate-binding protein